jgi:hypothetical protein
MRIIRENLDDGRTRTERMIDEFRAAQSRRRAKATGAGAGDRTSESGRDGRAQVAVARSATTPGSHTNE